MATNPFNVSAYCRNQPEQRLFPAPIVAKRVPTVNDINYPIGQLWVYVAGNAPYILTSVVANSATWQLLEAAAGAGVFASLVVTPGPVSLTGTTTINTAGAGTTAIGVGGTGAVTIGNATGNTVISAGNLSVTNGNLSLGTLGNKLNITSAASGTNASVGKTAAMAAGTIVVATTAVTANSIILVSHATAAGTMGQLSIGAITPGVNFAILTDNVLDTSTCNFLIIN